MATQLWHRVTVAGGTALADVAQIVAQLIPVQARWFFHGAVQSRWHPTLVSRRLHATMRTTVQGVSFYVAERVTDGGPVHGLRFHGTAQMRFLKTLNCFSAHKTLQAAGSWFALHRYRHCVKELRSGKYFRIRSDNKLADSCKSSIRKKRSKVVMFKL